ncbi:3-hydroxyacyl-CoA dehydrogenase NAD-binding domain-containing protein [Modestobacter sp. DSM 44400]|uniref:3-hydroxyacyl-CoA dehydrogenase NAD-binding domain-containing protein n=1 Tax=Modestobacter sp. DSM 44400 TaxID=1550230 RepID=UPI002739A21B|nr:3-hydroxyacyl-CoA dehydrogenase NAD-binding domain-containing protein [Modestobacter sp. DSM 44400]
MHFFNPVPASELVEVVVAPETAPEVGESTRGWVRTLGRPTSSSTTPPGCKVAASSVRKSAPDGRNGSVPRHARPSRC